jgi:mannosyltransferase
MSNEAVPVDRNSRLDQRLHKYFSPAVMLGLIVLLGTALRFYKLGSQSYWIDEMSTLVEGRQSIQQLISSGRLDQPPAYYFPFHYWEQLLGTTEVSARAFSALAGIISIVLIYLIGRELFGKKVGLLAAMLISISEFQIHYSQTARFYSYFELMVLASFLFFILALKSKRTLHFIFYSAASILMVYSHTIGIIILGAQNLFFILQVKKYRDLIKPWIICQAAVLLVFTPYVYALTFGKGGLEGTVISNDVVGSVPVPSIWDPVRSIYYFIFSPRGDRSLENIAVNYAGSAVLLLAGAGIYTFWLKKRNWASAWKYGIAGMRGSPDLGSKLLLLACWLVCPILLPFIFSFLIFPIYKSYYMIGAAPALYLLLAYGVYSIRKVVPTMVSIIAIFIIIVPGLGNYYTSVNNEQWREAAAFVKANASPEDVIVISPNQDAGIEQKTFDWYYQGTSQTCGLDTELQDSNAISTALMECVSGHRRFWVVIRDSSNSFDILTSYFKAPQQAALQLKSENHSFLDISVFLYEFQK